MSASLKMLLANESVSARRAHEIGLVHSVVTRDSLAGTAFTTAERLARIPPEVAMAIKRAIYEGLDGRLENGLRLEQRLVARVMQTCF